MREHGLLRINCPHAFQLRSEEINSNLWLHIFRHIYFSSGVPSLWLLSIYNLRVSPSLGVKPGILWHAQQFICSLITDDTGWMSGHRWPLMPTYHKPRCCHAGGRKIDRWTYYNDEQWKGKDRGCCVLLSDTPLGSQCSTRRLDAHLRTP